ncbi:hypothetical protein SDC9_187647 [bioreactor metagenome]|uniref:Uncharacterized protein n=1 Tax=bioreactor metagenome TaxID=1076179 RepID=A0A645HNS9_9ZZZZ
MHFPHALCFVGIGFYDLKLGLKAYISVSDDFFRFAYFGNSDHHILHIRKLPFNLCNILYPCIAKKIMSVFNEGFNNRQFSTKPFCYNANINA